ncbi:plastocyanin/azurin family copper-binding protein [Egibacter rhizosphaerae]|nr:plastocyanin/azurin family copper-binding protein [Egibacter rhizosphaerae]
MTRRLMLLAVLLVFGLAGCFSAEPEVTEEEQVPADQRDEVAEEPAEDADDDEAADDGEAEETVEFVADDNFYEDLPDSVSAGTVEFVMDNQGAAEHDMVIEELGDEEVVELTPGGETASGTVELEPGEYTLYCSVPGHREAGMEATITVEG